MRMQRRGRVRIGRILPYCLSPVRLLGNTKCSSIMKSRDHVSRSRYISAALRVPTPFFVSFTQAPPRRVQGRVNISAFAPTLCCPTRCMSALTLELLQRQDDVCSGAVIAQLRENTEFLRLSASEGELIIRRDAEDDEKLAKGIQISVDKKILPSSCDVPPVRSINVMGLSAEQVAQSIIEQLPQKEGNIIVLQGLSGTGKGTTVSKLKNLLPSCVTWSNGNVFRCYTYLIADAFAKMKKTLSSDEITRNPNVVADAVKRVSFKEVSKGTYDVLIDDTQRVKDIENTVLKTPLINSSVPIVAEQTQGEVIRFAEKAVKILSNAGYNIILEGRAQTLSYIYTKERFELIIPETSVLGQRRAAQRVMAKALDIVKATPDMNPSQAVTQAVHQLHL